MNWIGRAWEVFDYAVTAALVGLWRHRFMTGATVLTTALMLLMLNVFVVLVTHLNVALEALEHRVNVIAYIREDAPPGKVRELQSSLQNRSDVLEVIYVTKDEALARLREHFADRAELLAMVSDNPLPASLEIRARNPESLENIVSLLETKVGPESVLEEVALQEDIVERLLSLTTATRVAGVAMTAGLAVVSLFIVINTIRIAVYSRRQEIEVMKLVGATDWFVRWPFIFEGMLYGLLASLLTLLIVVPAYDPVVENFWALLSFLPVERDPQFVTKLALMTMVVGIALGAAGSYISVRRFLEV
ncbi:MAG: permease-like cell division protein FtsX [Rhodospirillaceae bacterium]|nr:permease-like cell division protein FtsX [Rhodospirillaceae bacterium]